MDRLQISFYLSLLLISLAVGVPTQFTANVVVTNDPKVSGVMKGQIYWSPNYMRINFDVGVNQVWDFTGNIMYKQCTACETSVWTEGQYQFLANPSFNNQSKPSSVNGVSCTLYSSTETTQNVHVAQTCIGSDGFPVQSVLTNGKIFTFSSASDTFDSSLFSVKESWNCPVSTCRYPADVVVVVDRSGSINSGEWQQSNDFVKKVADSFYGFQTPSFYNSNPSVGVRMGLVWFAGSGQDKTPGLTPDKTTFYNAVNSYRDPNGNGATNIACGIKNALNMLYADSRNVSKVIILVTDGLTGIVCDDQVDRMNAIRATPGNRFTLYAIHVADYKPTIVVNNTMLRYAGGIKQNYILGGDYASLQVKLGDILSVTCPPISDPVCNCRGFCGCGGKCICPSTCSASKCSSATCISGDIGCGQEEPLTCPSVDKCTNSFCDPNKGANGECTTSPVTCKGDLCNSASCDPQLGCLTSSNITSCDGYVPFCTTCNATRAAGKQCTVDKVCKCSQSNCGDPTSVSNCASPFCNNSNGQCSTTPVTCDTSNQCVVSNCDVNGSGKCEYTPKDCSDGNECTTDTCDPSVGCIHTPINETLVCDDYNVCTRDYCDPVKKCLNDPIPCVSDGSDKCTNVTCDPFLGCLSNPVDCYAVISTFAALIGDCHTLQCNQTQGCFLQPIDGAVVDDCGVCSGQQRPFFCNKAVLPGISVGVVVGATIGAVAGAAALGFGGKKGYDYYQGRADAAGGVQNNPLFVETGNNNNPMFNG